MGETHGDKKFSERYITKLFFTLLVNLSQFFDRHFVSKTNDVDIGVRHKKKRSRFPETFNFTNQKIYKLCQVFLDLFNFTMKFTNGRNDIIRESTVFFQLFG